MNDLTLFASKSPREQFLTGLLATWLAGDKAPTKDQKDVAEEAARAAMAVLEKD